MEMEVGATLEIGKEKGIEDGIATETKIDLVMPGRIVTPPLSEVMLEEEDMNDSHPSSLEATVYHLVEEVVAGQIPGLTEGIETETESVAVD